MRESDPDRVITVWHTDVGYDCGGPQVVTPLGQVEPQAEITSAEAGRSSALSRRAATISVCPSARKTIA